MGMVMEKLADICADSLISKISEFRDKNELKATINNFLEQEYSSKVATLSLPDEIDFEGICNYIKDSFAEDIEGYLFCIDIESRDKCYNTILIKALDYSQSTQKQFVEKFMKDLIDIIVCYKLNRVSESDRLLSTLVTQEVNKSIDKLGKTITNKIDECKKISSQNDIKKSTWVNESTGKELEENKIYSYGNVNARFTEDTIYAECKLPDGNVTYAEMDPKTGGVKNVKYAHPLCEYQIDIQPELIIKEDVNKAICNGEECMVRTVHLKWGRKVQLVYNKHGLINISSEQRALIDEMNKVIHIYGDSYESLI